MLLRRNQTQNTVCQATLIYSRGRDVKSIFTQEKLSIYEFF